MTAVLLRLLYFKLASWEYRNGSNCVACISVSRRLALIKGPWWTAAWDEICWFDCNETKDWGGFVFDAAGLEGR